MTLVVDASALVEFVLGSSRGRDAAMVMNRHEGALCAPGLIMAESLSALRALERRTSLSMLRAHQAVEDLLAVPLHQYGTEALVARIWSLRGHVTVYDAHYVALSEALEAPLLTGDHRLASATGELIEAITI